MSNYQHILIALDFSQHCKLVVQRGQQLAQLHGARLSLIHVVDYMPISGTEFGELIPLHYDITDTLIQQSKQRMDQIATEAGLDPQKQFLERGGVHNEVIRIAQEQQVDLLIVGSHGWSGLEMLLGSAADSILHHAHCDVLVVRHPS